jgi:glycerate kinase
MLPRTLLVAAGAFGEGLSADRVARAVTLGLRDGGWAAEPCPLQAASASEEARPPTGAALRELLDALSFDARMRGARALVVCQRELHEQTLAASPAFELATRARQAGVPTYAVTAENRLDAFDARVLDLQAIVEGAGARSLRNAGRKLAELV